jgi:uncharacterized C2H2 Zn-finger protein
VRNFHKDVDKDTLKKELENINLFICEVCLFIYTERKTLLRHKRETHKSQIVSELEILDPAAEENGLFDIPINSTSNIKVYKCNFCDRTFHSRSGRISHQNKVHLKDLTLSNVGDKKLAEENEVLNKRLEILSKEKELLNEIVVKQQKEINDHKMSLKSTHSNAFSYRRTNISYPFRLVTIKLESSFLKGKI